MEQVLFWFCFKVFHAGGEAASATVAPLYLFQISLKIRLCVACPSTAGTTAGTAGLLRSSSPPLSPTTHPSYSASHYTIRASSPPLRSHWRMPQHQVAVRSAAGAGAPCRVPPRVIPYLAVCQSTVCCAHPPASRWCFWRCCASGQDTDALYSHRPWK